jgi:ribonuclease-3
MDPTERLCQWLRETLGYTPRNSALFERALTHRSAPTPNNERLEFLGDAVLGLIAAEYLFERFAEADEGQLSRLRARVVSGESLAQLAGALGLSEWLALGPGEIKSGGAHRESILADALEALCGALYLDAGLEGARAVMLRVLAAALQLDSPAELKDPKTRLQELLQARGLALPRYSVESVEGALHAQVFRVTCDVPPLGAAASASGSSRRRAEQAAAARVLAQLQGEQDVSDR